MKIAIALLATAAAATAYLGLDRSSDELGCETITWPAAAAAAPTPATTAIAASDLTAPSVSAPQFTELPAIETLADREREVVLRVADVLGQDPSELARWAAPRDAVRDLGDIYSMLDDDGGRPHMREAFEQYMTLRDQLPIDPTAP